MNRFTRWLPLRWQIILHEWGALIGIGVLLVSCAALYVFTLSTTPLESAGHSWAKVESTFDVSDESMYDVRAVVLLPDGNRATVKARSIAEAQWLIDKACVEKRLRDDGRKLYRLAAPANCAD